VVTTSKMISFLVYSIRFNEADKGPFLSGFSFMLTGFDVDPDYHLTFAALATAFAFSSSVSLAKVKPYVVTFVGHQGKQYGFLPNSDF
jgi:hypothetical protein